MARPAAATAARASRAGRRSISFRNLPAGDYRGTLTLVDDFDNRTKPRNSFEIG